MLKMLYRIYPNIRLVAATERIALKSNLYLVPLVIEWYQKVCEIYNLKIKSIDLDHNRFYIEYDAPNETLKMYYASILADPDYEGKIPIIIAYREYLVEGISLKE
jgi:hypothetical protein